MKTNAPVIYSNSKNSPIFFTSYFKNIGEFVSSAKIVPCPQLKFIYQAANPLDTIGHMKFINRELIILNAKNRECIIRNNESLPYLKDEGLFNMCLLDELNYYRSLSQKEKKLYEHGLLDEYIEESIF